VPPERSTQIVASLISSKGTTKQLNANGLAEAVRVLREPRPKQKPTVAEYRDILPRHEEQSVIALRDNKPGDPIPGVFPLVAIQIEIE
jgi:hypothetical protein